MILLQTCGVAELVLLVLRPALHYPGEPDPPSHPALLDDLAQGMLEHETLDYEQIEAIKQAHLSRSAAERSGAAPSPAPVAA